MLAITYTYTNFNESVIYTPSANIKVGNIYCF